EGEVLPADERQDAGLQAGEPADERVQRDEQRELARVGPQAEADGRAHAGVTTPPARFAATIAAWSAGRGGESASSSPANTSASSIASNGLCARSKPSEETGLPERPRPQTEPPKWLG